MTLGMRDGAALSLVLGCLLGGSRAAAREPARQDAEGRTPSTRADTLPGRVDSLAGNWEGTLKTSGIELRVVFRIQRAKDGSYSATMDSPDQGARGILVSDVSFSGRAVKLTSAAVGGVFEGRLAEDGSTIEGEWRQGGATLPLVLRRVEQVTEVRRPQEPVPPYPYEVEQVRYPNAEVGNELAGTLTLPRGEGPFPAAVLISGSGPQDRDETVFGHRPFWILADYLTRRGIAVLRFDDRGVGGSTGSFPTATSEDFASDVRAGIAYLRTRPRVDAKRIGLIGHSEGGLIAPMVAAEDPSVAFVVLMAGPGLPGTEILERQAALIARAGGAPEEAIERNRRLQLELFEIVREEPDTAAAAKKLQAAIRQALASLSEEEKARAGLQGDPERVVEAQVRQVNSPWFRFFLTYDPRPTLRRVKAPVLAIGGELDLQVPPKQDLDAIAAALKAGGNPDFTVKQLAGLNHLFQEAKTGAPAEYGRIEQTVSPEALKLIGDWILKRMGG
ncbi:MAG: alpha/beta hydrolase family protein [Gemmatimonadota bacterium]